MPKINIPEIRAQISATLKAEKKIRDDMLANGVEGSLIDPDFIRAQGEFDGIRMDFALAGPIMSNRGIDRNAIFGASAKALGEMLGNLTLACGSPNERHIVKMCFDRALSETIMPPQQAPQPVDLETATPEGSA
ncbi:MAG: hypothetical protein E6R03_17900 [Hyphomicrobiaceae bacterium]|nr:MAG: hypothetical protein E6R03_17900 [Hyphomicrobiaceae bacterium]